MVTEVRPPVHEPDREDSFSESFIEHQRRRAGILVYDIGAFGLANTVRIIYNTKIAPDNNEAAIRPRPNPNLRYRPTLTTSRTDLATYREVISDEVYRLPRWLEAGINGRPIVDIGSCIGISPAYFASRYPNSPVVAIEASNRNYEYLQMNAEPYGGQIDPVHAAFASEPGQVGMTKLEPGLHNHVSYLFSNHTDSELHGETAPAITPKDILGLLNDTERIVVKVDIEGAEREIFSSPTIDPLLIRADLLLAETHNQYAPGSSQAVYEAAERNGLKPVQPGGHTEIYYRI